jgi:phosphatidylglycerophosphate synthase
LLGYFVLRHFRHHVEVKPHWSGKLSTFFVFIAIAAVLFQAGVWIDRFCALGAFFAVVATAVYIRQGLEMLHESGHTQPVGGK